jgi:hypothetical protein
MYDSGHGRPTWRKRYRHEGFRVIGTDRVPAFEADGAPKLNAKGNQVMSRSVRVEKLNRRWAQVNVPGCAKPSSPVAPADSCATPKSTQLSTSLQDMPEGRPRHSGRASVNLNRQRLESSSPNTDAEDVKPCVKAPSSPV